MAAAPSPAPPRILLAGDARPPPSALQARQIDEPVDEAVALFFAMADDCGVGIDPLAAAAAFAVCTGAGDLALARKVHRHVMDAKVALDVAATYEEWVRAAKVLDKMSGQVNEADFYDEELIRSRLEELQRRREEGSLRDVVFCMCGDLVRNLGNMCNPELHKGRLELFPGYKPSR